MDAKIGIVTCVELGQCCIEEVLASGGNFSLFVTLKDELARGKSGRIYLDDLAKRTHTPLVKIKHINDAYSIRTIRDANLDWLFIVGWSQIADASVLSSVRQGVLGMHPTLLPEGRGRASIPWAILKRLPETGVTLFKLDEGVDTGPILAQERIVLSDDETATRLYARIGIAHKLLIRNIWGKLVSNCIEVAPQDQGSGSYWPARRPQDGQLDLTMTVAEVDCLVRATTRPYPGAFFESELGRLRIWSGEAGNTASSDGVPVLQFADGNYLPLDYQWER